MAKRKTRTQIVRAIPVRQTAAPVIRVQTSPVRAPKVKHHRRRHGGAGGGLGTKNMLGHAIGGAVFGFVEKSFPNLPTVPILGRAGTVALACHFLGKGRGGLVQDIGLAAATIAGYQLGKNGQIAGDDDV